MEAVETLLTTHNTIRSVLQRRLRKAQATMKLVVDTHRRDVTYYMRA